MYESGFTTHIPRAYSLSAKQCDCTYSVVCTHRYLAALPRVLVFTTIFFLLLVSDIVLVEQVSDAVTHPVYSDRSVLARDLVLVGLADEKSRAGHRIRILPTTASLQLVHHPGGCHHLT